MGTSAQGTDNNSEMRLESKRSFHFERELPFSWVAISEEIETVFTYNSVGCII